MQIRNAVMGCLALLMGGALNASTWIVSFDPDNPVNTNGWAWGETTAQTNTASTKPGGRKFDPSKAGDTIMIESPLHSARIRSVALSAWGNNINAGNTSRVDVVGRTAAGMPYTNLFSRTGLANTLVENEKYDRFDVPDDFDCRQVQISYTKGSGTWVLSKVTLVDDAIRAETPTDLKVETLDAVHRHARVTWSMPEGVTNAEWRTFTTTPAGGVEASSPLWRAPLEGVPAATKDDTSVDAAKMVSFGLADWVFDNVRQPTVAGALLLGWKSNAAGTLTTPPIGTNLVSGCLLVVRTKKATTTTGGNLPIFIVSGNQTNSCATISITSTLADYEVVLPSLAATDRLLFHSSTLENVKNKATLIAGIAICAPGTYVPEYAVTNDVSEAEAVVGGSLDLTVPDEDDGEQLWIEVRSIYGEERSAWTSPFHVTLTGNTTDTGDNADDDGGSGGTSSGETDELEAPCSIRMGLLPDGKTIRVGWNSPEEATNTRLRVWSLTASGGLSAMPVSDLLWHETFSAAPATNNTINLSTEAKWNHYSDHGATVWDVGRCMATYLSTEAGAIRLGKSDGAGEVAACPGIVFELGTDPGGTEPQVGTDPDGEGTDLTLVVTARRATESAGTDLRAMVLTIGEETITTNWTGTATIGDTFTEVSMPIDVALTGKELFVLTSPTNRKDGRILLSDIAIVRNYVPITVTTNAVEELDLGRKEWHDLVVSDTTSGEDEGKTSGAEGLTRRYVALCAQDSDGRSSTWTSPFELDAADLGEWHDRFATLRGGQVATEFDLAALPVAAKGLDVSISPFTFLLDGDDVSLLAYKDVKKITSGGIYACTNVLDSTWAVLVPRSPSGKDAQEAEMRLAVEIAMGTARRLELSGVFAQLGATNRVEKSLRIQWRAVETNGVVGTWTDFGSYATSYTVADAQPDLSSTVQTLSCVADKIELSAGKRLEVRIVSMKEKDSGREPPLGFRDIHIRVTGTVQSFGIVFR